MSSLVSGKTGDESSNGRGVAGAEGRSDSAVELERGDEDDR
jgi:hypothetical protein